MLGCISLNAGDSRTISQWSEKCAEDSGELLLINSPLENQTLANFFSNNSANIIIIIMK